MRRAPNLIWPARHEAVFLALLLGMCVSGHWELGMASFLLWRGLVKKP
jgi:hypothetical protein